MAAIPSRQLIADRERRGLLFEGGDLRIAIHVHTM